MKKFISSILLTIFLLTTNCYAFALDSNSTFDEIVKNKSEIPTDISIKKKKGKYGVVDKKTKEVLIPYEYKSISKLGIDTVMLCEVKNKCIISTNNNIPLTNEPLEKKSITIRQIKKNKTSDIENSIFYGIINSNKGLLIIPVYSSKNLFKDFFEAGNSVSWIKFEGYPFDIENMTLFIKKDNRANYIKQNGEAFEIGNNNLNFEENYKNSFTKNIYTVTGIAYPTNINFKEEIIVNGENTIIKFHEISENIPENEYKIFEKGQLFGVKDKDGKEIISPKQYMTKTSFEKFSDKQKSFIGKFLFEDNSKSEQINKVTKKKNPLTRVTDSVFGIIGLAFSPLLLINLLINPFFWILVFALNDLPNQMCPEPGHQNDKGLFW